VNTFPQREGTNYQMKLLDKRQQVKKIVHTLPQILEKKCPSILKYPRCIWRNCIKSSQSAVGKYNGREL